MVFQRRHDMAPQPVPASPVSPSAMRAAEPARFDRPVYATASAQPATNYDPIVESVIGNDLSIEGETITIRCKGSLKILGNIQADLHSKRLEVGKEAVINGAIAADTIDVFGRVQGSILGAKVVLHAGSDVEGDIMSQLLSVEEGANFDGRSRRVTDPSEIAPQLERPVGLPVARGSSMTSALSAHSGLAQPTGSGASPLN